MRTFIIILVAGILTVNAWAQSPMKMSYQAVIRNTRDELVTNQPIGLRISILQGSVNGTVVYTETQTAVSNSIGLVSIEVGGGPGFDAINWANGPYFIKTETDPEGGTNYTITNTSQLLSVPYALHAKTAEAFSDGITETDPVFGASPAKTISGSDITNWNNKQDKLIAGKNIVIVGDTISATGLPPDGTAPGEMVYWNGSTWVVVPPGTHGKILYFCNGVPTWGECPSLLTTAAVSGITTTTAVSGGYISSNGGSPVTARGVCWSTSASPVIEDNHTLNGSDTGTFISSLTNLLPNTTYFVRTYATNGAGTTYGNELSFKTSSLNQNTVCFAAPDGVNDYNWSYKDYVIPEGFKIDSVYMDASRPGYSEDKYDLLFAFCPGTTTYKSTVVKFLFDYEAISTPMYNTWLDLTKMSVKATGMVRVKLPTHERAVWNNLCIAISEITELFTPGGGVTDIDGNYYNSIIIGTQEWMIENLKTTKYNDGTSIPLVTSFSEWASITTPGYCWYNNDITNKSVYGALYNWYVVNTGKLAPIGWHVPTDAEWEVLEGFVDTRYNYGDSEWDNILNRGYDAGKHLKSTSGWASGGNGLDTYKFNILPGGYRHVQDNFKTFGDYAGYWTSTPRYMRDVTFNEDRVWRYNELPNYGWFVRCVKD